MAINFEEKADQKISIRTTLTMKNNLEIIIDVLNSKYGIKVSMNDLIIQLIKNSLDNATFVANNEEIYFSKLLQKTYPVEKLQKEFEEQVETIQSEEDTKKGFTGLEL